MYAHQFTHHNPKEIMTSHLPEVQSTSAERLAALKEAKALLFVPGVEAKTIFGASATAAQAPATPDLFRVAEYITTGHDYLDTHPKGKRRPLVQEINVHAVGMPEEVAKKLVGDDFIDSVMEHINAEHKDEPEHQPQVPGDRPRFGRASDFS